MNKINKEKPIKTPKKYEIIQQNDYITKKASYIGLVDNKVKTKKYSSLFNLLEKNPSFKKSFNNNTLKNSKVSNIKR